MYKKKICMVVQNPIVKGGISSVISGYRGSWLEQDAQIIYVESYTDGNKLKKLLKAITGYLHFIKVLIINKPDIVHIHSSFGPSFYRKIPFVYISKWFKKFIINHCHGADFNTFYVNADKRKKKLVKRVYNQCDKVIALSNEWRENLIQIVPKEKITVIENYSIVNEDALKQRETKQNGKQVLFLGEIGKRKGCYDIPDVIDQVTKSIPEVKFVLGGSGDISNITELIKKKNLEKNVSFPGWVRGEEKDRLLRDSDIFFLPSYNEGMPMAILDAMGYGLPIISTDVGGISKIVKENINGKIHKPGDVNGFAESIIALLNNDFQLTKSGIESSIIVKEYYSLERHLTLLLKLYKEVK
ncbi:glycosyltransferase family 4 protein [Priestia flexa]|uniref:glycosyltransferase family 4 protein n=1 Tax=Priestia flexa TaxID=86664 RepID=UPI000473F317|nr:glycosyltransferase family 4 protein [Priestia flexa]